MFLALGLVANYSQGVMSQGHFTVSNHQSTYYGASIQHFSKLGVTLRIGLN